MGRLDWANSLRGIAAIVVVIAHLGVLFWTNQGAIAPLARQPALWDGADGAPLFARILAWLPVEFGALGVALFFLLSGYVIAISTTKYSRRGFTAGRLMRVLPTYAAGFLVTCLVILVVGDPYDELSPSTVLAGLVPGLPYLLKVPAPADGIVWTLIVELAFYAVVLVLYRSISTRWYSIVAVAATCVLAQVLLPTPVPNTVSGGVITLVLIVCPFLPIMLIGVALSSFRRGQLTLRSILVLVPLLAGTYFALHSYSKVAPTGLEYRLTFIGAIGAFVLIEIFGRTWKSNRVLDFLAAISYPLYVVHAVLGWAILSALTRVGLWTPLALLAATAVVIGTAFLLHLTVEQPSHRLGQQWARRLSRRALAAADLPS